MVSSSSLITGRWVATIAAHEQIMRSSEEEPVATACGRILSSSESLAFWELSAGDVLNSISSTLNDQMFPEQAEDAAVLNAFQLVTCRLAQRAELDTTFREMVLAIPARHPRRHQPGAITKLLGIAINDFDNGRLSRKNLLTIFQDAIDNGDILAPDNEVYVVGHVLPLLKEGLLERSDYVDLFEERMEVVTRKLLDERTIKSSARKPWWRLWN